MHNVSRGNRGAADGPAAEMLNSLGRESVAAAVGVDMRRIHRAAFDERLPALWYAALCDLAGYDLPHELFTFKRADRGAA